MTASQGERRPATEPGDLSAAPARVAGIVEAAERAASELREQAEQRGRERIAEADRAAEHRVQAAEEEAQEILHAARSQSEAARNEALAAVGDLHAEADERLREAERVPVRRGRSRALLVAKLADARAESAGESLLRASIHLLGLPMPELQREFRGDSGRRYSVDCYWPDQRFVLEFDGRAKYLDPALRGGRSAEQVVVDEKEREDEIRPQVRGMARVGWSVAAAPWRLEARLRAAGFRFPPRR